MHSLKGGPVGGPIKQVGCKQVDIYEVLSEKEKNINTLDRFVTNTILFPKYIDLAYLVFFEKNSIFPFCYWGKLQSGQKNVFGIHYTNYVCYVQRYKC